MIAYSMAGVSAVQGAPAAGGEATLGADSVKFVQAPLDVMLAYFYRAKRTTSLLPVAKRLPWLMMRDAEERAEWVARFRESSSTLGQVVKEVFVARDAHWIPSLQPSGQQAGGTAPTETVKSAPTSNQFQLKASLSTASQSLRCSRMVRSCAKASSMANAKTNHLALWNNIAVG